MAEILAEINNEQGIFTIATLPATPNPFMRAWVTNGLVATGWGVAVAGTGTATLPVWWDASTSVWRYGG
jgi:hypothetical protein